MLWRHHMTQIVLQNHCHSALTAQYSSSQEFCVRLCCVSLRVSLPKLIKVRSLVLWLWCHCPRAIEATLGLYSISGKTSYRQISSSLEAARLDVIVILSPWNFTGISAALLPSCMWIFQAIGNFQAIGPIRMDEYCHYIIRITFAFLLRMSRFVHEKYCGFIQIRLLFGPKWSNS